MIALAIASELWASSHFDSEFRTQGKARAARVCHDGTRADDSVTSEAWMKTLFVIIGLCPIETACTMQNRQAATAGTLLEFGDLASEITISRQDEAAWAAPPESWNVSPVDSS